MNGQEIFLGLSYISRKYIEEAETETVSGGAGKAHRIRRPFLLAAVIALLLLLVGCAAVYVLKMEHVKISSGTASGSTSRLRSVPGTPCGSSAAPPGTSTHQTAASPAQASAAMPAARRRRFCSDIFSVPSPFWAALSRRFGRIAHRPAMPDAHCIMFRPVCARKRSGIAKIRRNIDSNN